MGERFVVVPVDRGVEVAGSVREPSDAVVADPASDSGGSSGTVEEKEAGKDFVFEPQEDPEAVVPILKYNREPNKYVLKNRRK